MYKLFADKDENMILLNISYFIFKQICNVWRWANLINREFRVM